jgi:hypothetical protein
MCITIYNTGSRRVLTVLKTLQMPPSAALGTGSYMHYILSNRKVQSKEERKKTAKQNILDDNTIKNA